MKWISLIASILADVILRLFRKGGQKHTEGYSDGTTEERLKEKARKDGWDV